jgi:uncharacterized repeat protein (TIGR01451 family)
LAGGATCSISLNITGTTAGVKNNSVAINSTEAGIGNTSNASITVLSAPIISKTFGAASIPLNGSTSLSFTVQNNNAGTPLSGIGFTDTFPAGLVISNPTGQTGTCGAGTITAIAGANFVSLAGATLASNSSCTFSVNITGIATGAQNNVTSNVTSAQGGTGGTASASVSVVAPPVIAKVFTPASIAPGGSSVLSFTITNPAANSAPLTGVAFTDVLPSGILEIPGALTNTCGGTFGVTTAAAITTVTHTNGTIAAGSSCTLSLTVTGSTAGTFVNTTGSVTSTNGGTGNAASATLQIAMPPSISKAFGAASMGLAGSTSLTFTVTNPNSTLASTGVAFTDNLPAGLVVATPSGLTGACGAGTVTAAAGAQSVSLSGGTLPASGNCSFSVNVTPTSAGAKVNTTGTVSATNGGVGNSATASITVLAPDLTIAKSHSGNFFQGQAAATYTVLVTNAGAGPTAGTVTITEAPPAGITLTGLVGAGWTCNIAGPSCTRTDALAAAASYPPITVTGIVAPAAPASIVNSVSVSGGGELNLANDTATDTATVTPPPDFTLTASPTTITIRAGQSAMYGLTVTSLNNAFGNATNLTATGLPAKSALSFTPAAVTPGANPAISTLVVATNAGDPFVAGTFGSNRSPLLALLLPFFGIVLSGLGLRNRAWRQGKLKFALVVAVLVSCGFALNGCASARNFQNLGTTPGTYNISITATSGTTQHSVPVTLIVQP